MLLRKPFVEEVNEKLKASNCHRKIIFLDIDGVIYCGAESDSQHHQRIKNGEIDSIKSHPLILGKIPNSILDSLSVLDLSAALGFDKNSLNNLHNLCAKYDAKIVVSSAWREGRSLDQIKAIFSIHGLEEYIIDCTPVLNGKGQEIEAWLLSQSEVIDSFVILDDGKFDFYERFPGKFVECRKLFSDSSLYEKAKSILEQTKNYDDSVANFGVSTSESNFSQINEVREDISVPIEKNTIDKTNSSASVVNTKERSNRCCIIM